MESPSVVPPPLGSGDPLDALSRLRANLVLIQMVVGGALALAITARLNGMLAPVTPATSLFRWAVIFAVPLAYLLSRINARVLVAKARDELASGMCEGKNDAEISAMFRVYCSQALSSAMIMALAGLLCVAAFYLVGSMASFALTIIFICAIRAQASQDPRVADWVAKEVRQVRHERSVYGQVRAALADHSASEQMAASGSA